jgi:hypothetical protein
MHSATFLGEVQQGRLHIGEPLAEFEGKRVLVTLIAPDAPLPSGEPAAKLLAALEAELLEDTGSIRAPARSSQTVTAQVVAVGRRPPRLGGEED